MTDFKRCFVIMGFGVKTDFATGRKLDLDKSYKLLIKPVLEQKQLQCVRADEIMHSGTIDMPMYQELLQADIVIADLSTANLNAVYELGIRHALRPRTTIVISENLLPYPFDLNHIKIVGYSHLGDAIDYDEVMRFRQVLGDTIDKVLQDETTDSPIYTYLDLVPPALQEQLENSIKNSENSLPVKPGENTNPSLAIIIEEGEKAMHEKNYSSAKGLFQSAFFIVKAGLQGKENVSATSHAYLIQRLAYACYKSKEPSELEALKEASDLLESMDVENTNDPQTLILAGKIEKNLYFLDKAEKHLNRAILFYERGYYLLNSRYNGINLAYLLNNRVHTKLDASTQDKITDMVLANRFRMQVLELCDKHWEAVCSQSEKMLASGHSDELTISQLEENKIEKFWILANRAEAHFGLGNMEEYKSAREAAIALKCADWMLSALDNQVKSLRALLQKYAHLLELPGKE